MKNRKEVGKFILKSETVSYLTDSLTGILKEHYDLDESRMERLKEKHQSKFNGMDSNQKFPELHL